MRRQSLAIHQLAVMNGIGNLLGKREIGRPAELLRIGTPICHDLTLIKFRSIDNPKIAFCIRIS
jgi:hypothetical protein